MIFTWGSHFYGKCDALGGAFVTTRFAHAQFLPLVPLRSYLIVSGTSSDRVLAVPLVVLSVLAAYARLWGPMAAIAGVLLSAGGRSVALGFPLALAGFALALYGWTRLGRLDATGRAQREAYAAFAGAPVDVALIARATTGPDAAEALAWLADITRRAEDTIRTEGADLASSYRGTARHTDWRDVAERARAAAPACRNAALTLARIAWAQAKEPAEREDAAGAHARIWEARGGATP